MKPLKNLFFILLLFGFTSFAQKPESISLPLAGNAYSSLHVDGSRTITNKGIANWNNPKEFFTAYFRVSKAGTVTISIEDKPVINGSSTLEFTINNQSKKITFDQAKAFDGKIGEWKITDTVTLP